MVRAVFTISPKILRSFEEVRYNGLQDDNQNRPFYTIAMVKKRGETKS